VLGTQLNAVMLLLATGIPADGILSLLFCKTYIARLLDSLLWIVHSHAPTKEPVCTVALCSPWCQIDNMLGALLTGALAVRALEDLHVHISLPECYSLRVDALPSDALHAMHLDGPRLMPPPDVQSLSFTRRW
jgi:hypothetical protein